MSTRKKCKLAHAEALRQPDAATTREPIDWSLCVLCQEHSAKPLTCPAKSLRTDVGAGYDTLGENLERFLNLGIQPVPIDLHRLDEGDGIGKSLAHNNAQWHISCRLKCCTSRLARAEVSSLRGECSDASGGLPYMLRGTEIIDPVVVYKCFFCDEIGTESIPLHEAMTPRITDRVRQCAMTLQDQKLIAKLSDGDLVAQEAKYHAKCLVKLYNATNRKDNMDSDNEKIERTAHGIALVELMGYVEDTKLSGNDIAPVFKLSDLLQLYTNRLVELGVEVSGRVHSTDLKNRILANMPGLQAYKQGRDVYLTFSDVVGIALRDACLDDGDDEAICLAKAARILRRDMLGMKAQFDGSFQDGCQEDSVPKSLVALVGMIMDGPNIARKDEDDVRQTTLSIAQLLQYNSSVRRREGSTGIYHSKSRETPLPIYLGMMIHGHTRKRELVDTLFRLGVSISYDRVMEISMEVAISAAQQYKSDGVVCPLILRKNLFTTAAVDNIDHNPSSSTAHGAFHGTGISLFQNRVTESDGIKRLKSETQLDPCSKHIPPLPESYTTLTPVTAKKDPVISPTVGTLSCDGLLVKTAMDEEKKWQDNTRRLIRDEIQSIDDPLGWAAFHSNTQRTPDFAVTIGSLLPLFPDDSKSVLRIMLRTVDTDVLVLAVSTVVLHEGIEIWVAFGTGKHLRYIPAHDIATDLGREKARALPMFHAFTGCDTVSSFAGRGKKTAFDIWRSFDAVTQVFSTLFTDPSMFNDHYMSVLETYVVLLYDRTSTETTVDSARKHIFTTKARPIEAIPPTSAALLQHTKRAIFQGGYVWGQALVRSPALPSPETYGWQKCAAVGWQPLWTTLPEAAASCSELLRCGCQKGCRGLCKCVKAALKCTSLCRCGGNCDHNDGN